MMMSTYYLIFNILLTIQVATAFIAPSTTSSLHNHVVPQLQQPLRMAAETDISGPPYSGPPVKPILDSVKYPSDMKRLDMREVKQVCEKSMD
jgi:1-deoxy-D-xylulose-5-phosphate synthase